MKKFLSDLSWNNYETDAKLPIFHPDELSNNPLKWLKHLLLVRVGLRKFEELKKEICRITMSDDGIKQARAICTQLLSSGPENSSLIIIKIILPDTTMDLPNYRITTLESIKSTFFEIESKYFKIADELWICRSNTSSLRSNLGGRIIIPLDTNKFTDDVLEIIWNTSPRLIDQYRTLQLPYLLARRISGMLAFSIEVLFIPEEIASVETRLQLKRDFSFIAIKIYSHREQIEKFAQILGQSEAKELVLEYKLDGGSFKFIDWDTDSDTKILPIFKF